MERLSLNLNEVVEVTLTKVGKRVLDDYRLSTKTESKTLFRYDENDKYVDQLWNIMAIFGSHINGNCGNEPFSEIVICSSDLQKI